MKKNELIIIFASIFFISLLFFNKFFLQGFLPFPGDLLISSYSPWKFESYLGYNPGSYPNKAQYFDTILQIYPWRNLSVDLIKNLTPPLWNPYNFSGTPLLANIQSAPFYPPNLIYLLLPEVYSWSILVILQPILAILGMYLFTRVHGLRKVSSIFASCAYGLSLYMTVFLEYNTLGHIVAILPFILYGFEKFLKTKQFRFLLFFIFSLAIIFFAGHLQLAVLSLCFSVLYCIFRLFTERAPVKINLVVALSFITAVLISGVQLIPSFELVQNSARVSQDYNFLIEKLLMQPTQLAMLFAPDIFGNPATRNFLSNETYPTKAGYIGILPLFFAVVGAFSLKKNKTILFFLAVSFLALIFLTRNPVSELFYLIEIPLFSSSSPSNAWFLFSFCVAVLAGFGMNRFIDGKNILRGTTAFLILAVVAFLLSLVYMKSAIYPKQVVIPLSIFLITLVAIFLTEKLKLNRIVLGAIIVVFTVLDLFYLFQKFNPLSPKEFIYPPTEVTSFLKEKSNGERVIGVGQASILPNLQTDFRIYSPEGYDPLYPKTYAQFIYSYEEEELFNEFSSFTRSNAGLGDMFGDGKLMERAARLKVIDTLNVRYVLDRVENGNSEKTFPVERFRPIYDKGGWKVYENLRSLPRAYLVNDVKVADDTGFAEIFYSETFDPRESVILSTNPNIASEDINGRVSINYLKENEVSYRAVSSTDAIFVLSDSFYPGWKAFIDGKETEVIRANHAFRAVLLPKGEHDVVFVYSPKSFIYGMYISIIGISSLIVLNLYLRRK